MSDAKCPTKVRRGDTWHPRWEPCGRRAKPNGYCGTHDPEKVKARQEKKRAEFDRYLAACKLRDAAPALADALAECIGALEDELAAAGDDVATHPVLHRHQQIVERASEVLRKAGR